MTRSSPEHPFVVDERIRRMIAGAVAEIDLAQIAALRKLTPAERCQQSLALIDGAERVAAHRLRQRQSELSEVESIIAVRKRALIFREQWEEQWRNRP
jgi:hypothetical protein